MSLFNSKILESKSVMNSPSTTMHVISLAAIAFLSCKTSANGVNSEPKDIIGERKGPTCLAGEQVDISDDLAAKVARVTDGKLCARKLDMDLCIAKVVDDQSCEDPNLTYVHLCTLRGMMFCTTPEKIYEWAHDTNVAMLHDDQLSEVCSGNATNDECTLDLTGSVPKVTVKKRAYICKDLDGFLFADLRHPGGALASMQVDVDTLRKIEGPVYGTRKEIEKKIEILRTKGVCK
jgi:hypothetical protein